MQQEAEHTIATIVPKKIEILINKVTTIVKSYNKNEIDRSSCNEHAYNKIAKKRAADSVRKRGRVEIEDENNIERDSDKLENYCNEDILIDPQWLAKELLIFLHRMRIYRSYVNSSMKIEKEFIEILKGFEESAFEALTCIEKSIMLIDQKDSNDKKKTEKKQNSPFSSNLDPLSMEAYYFSVLITITEQCKYTFIFSIEIYI